MMFIIVLLPEPLVPDDGDEFAVFDVQIHVDAARAPPRGPCCSLC